MAEKVLVLLAYFILLKNVQPVIAITVEQHRSLARLYDTLLNGSPHYNSTVLPGRVCKPNEKTCPFIVQARLFLMRVHDIIENTETLETTVRVQLGWIDPGLTWDPKEYQGVNSTTLPGGSIWVPDLQFANSVDDMYSVLSSKDFGFRLTNDGQIWWHTTGKITTRCAIDVTYYPFDYQRCAIVIESVIFPATELQMIIRPDKSDPVSLMMYTENERWKLVEGIAYPMIYKSGNTPFSRIHFWLLLKRDSFYYEQVFLIPIALMSALQIVTFLIPIHYVDRVPQATVVLLSAFFIEGYIADRLPRTAQLSLIQTYLNILIGISVATIVICVLTIEMMDPDDGLEWWGITLIKTKPCRKKGRISTSAGGVSISVKAAEARNGEDGEEKPLKHSHFVAAVVNFVGFAGCVLLVVIYPSVAFHAYISTTPPALPRPPQDNISVSYYAELLD